MERRITDLLDCIQDDTVQLRPKDVASLERVTELAMNKVGNINITYISVQKRSLKVSAILIAAALTFVLLTGVALATGAVQSIFRSMRDLVARDAAIGQFVGDDAEKYEKIDALSNKEEVTVTLSAMNNSQFTLCQSYYDGEQLMLGYNFDALTVSAEFGFGPGHEKFDMLKPFEDKENHAVPMLNLNELLSPDEYAQFMQTLAETGNAGVIFCELFLGDHITLADGMDMGPNYVNYQLDNGVYFEFLELPEEARNQDELSIQMTIKRAIWYYYADATGGYYHMEYGRPETLTFTIPRSVG
ncbi:MAG: hypothetical protein FWH55_00045 [Oscillospiraceae bacterium]|nr:hypothetical protein [Oscillospiraceae bacterium]